MEESNEPNGRPVINSYDMGEGRKVEVVTDPQTGMYLVKMKGAGMKPAELTGGFTSITWVERAIEQWKTRLRTEKIQKDSEDSAFQEEVAKLEEYKKKTEDLRAEYAVALKERQQAEADLDAVRLQKKKAEEKTALALKDTTRK
jgi:hypothetical protein